MNVQIFINTTFNETRIAIFEDGKFSEIYIERNYKPQLVGNIYKGKVGRIVPGMQAGFIDIGLEKSGFISVEDVYEESLMSYFLDEKEKNEQTKKIKQPIQQVLKENQEIIVQVIKEPVNGKGPKLSSYIGIPGKYTVLLGTIDMIGISKRIDNSRERERLTEILKRNKPDNIGFIARTASEGIEEEDIKEDMNQLISTWEEIKAKSEYLKSPALLYEEPKLHIRAVRDFITSDVSQIIIDSKNVYDEVRNYLTKHQSEKKKVLKLYRGKEPLFSKYGIENQIEKLYQKKVWLKSGAYLIIEEAEGLTVIDVNTGKFTGENDHQETIFKINSEAAQEAARQIRLRNLVGIIVIDFIDMKSEELKQKLYETFANSLKNDRARSVIHSMSSFGVIQLTRQRGRESILKVNAEPCTTCNGLGYLKSKDTISYEILRNILNIKRNSKIKSIKIRANQQILDTLNKIEGKNLDKFSRKNKIRLIYEVVNLEQDKYEIVIEQ